MHQVDVLKGGLVEVPSLEPDGLSGLGQALLLLGAQVDVTVLGGAKSREKIQSYLSLVMIINIVIHTFFDFFIRQILKWPKNVSAFRIRSHWSERVSLSMKIASRQRRRMSRDQKN